MHGTEGLEGTKRRRGRPEGRHSGFNVVDYISILSIIVLVAFFTIMNPNFLNAFNIRNMLTDISPLLIMGCGVTFVLLIGSIDLSIGSVCSTAAVILALFFPRIGTWAYLFAASRRHRGAHQRHHLHAGEDSFFIATGGYERVAERGLLISGGAPRRSTSRTGASCTGPT